jgi:selenide,water dikinase
VLRPLRETFHEDDFPNLLIGLGSPDDAAVYQIGENQALIFTTDFFTPVVDDPYTYGAIAAANAMSDVYAMGGQVVLALSIAAFPPKLPGNVIGDILRGAAEKVAEAGGVIAGGHTIDDDEPKFGLAVMGTIHPGRLGKKGGARPGDQLLLTKPLGVGIITTAAKGDAAHPEHLEGAIQTMLQLNRQAAELAQQVTFHAMTDITGFALLGHAFEMASPSKVRFRFFLDRLPFLAGALEYADLWLFPGGSCNNQRTFEEHMSFNGLAEEMQMLLFTPETSGGLLIALPPAEANRLEDLCQKAGQSVWRVGDVIEGQGIEILSQSASSPLPNPL